MLNNKFISKRKTLVVFTLMLFLSQNLLADEKETKLVVSFGHEVAQIAGLNVEAGAIIKNRLYITGQFGKGAFVGLYQGGGVFAGHYFELGEKKVVKLVPGLFGGHWFYDMAFATTMHGTDTRHYYGGTFCKFLLGSNRVNLDLTAKCLFGREQGSSYGYKYDYNYGYIDYYYSWDKFSALPALHFGVTMTF